MKSCMDSDDDRMDFCDPIDEEHADKLVKEFRKKGRRLHASEIDDISRGNIDVLKDSVLNSVMVQEDYQYL